MRIVDKGAAGSIQSPNFARKIQEATLEGQQSLSPAQQAGLHKFYGQALETLGSLRDGSLAAIRDLQPADLEKLFPEGPLWAPVLEATAPQRNDNGDARQLRSEYRSLLRQARREETRAANGGQPPGAVSGPDGSRLERLGTTVRRTDNRLGSVQVEQFRLDEQGNPARELLLAYDGSAPQRLTARPDGSANWQQLRGNGVVEQHLPPGRTGQSAELPASWWRQRSPGEEWDLDTTPAQVHAPEAPKQPGLGGLSPNQTQVVARHYQQQFAGDLRADAAREPKVADAIEALGGKLNSAPVPAIPAAQVAGDTKEFCDILDRIFSKLDKNQNGTLTLKEAKAAVRDPQFRGNDAAAVAALMTLIQFVDSLEDGLSKEQLNKLRSGEAGADLNTQVSSYYSGKKASAGSLPGQVFNGQPDPMQVQQGQFGTCYFIAALVAKAQADPESIKKMIKDNGNGTFTVSFPGAETVTIPAPTQAEQLVHAGAGQNGKWVTIIELAYGKMKNDDAWFSEDNPMDKVEGGQLKEGINPLSQNGVDTDELWATSKNTTRTKLQKALAAHKMITASVSPDWFSTSDVQDQHAYSVIGYDPVSDRVKIRNPWGAGGSPRAEPQNSDGTPKDGKADGVFELSLSEFDGMFSQISYEE